MKWKASTDMRPICVTWRLAMSWWSNNGCLSALLYSYKSVNQTITLHYHLPESSFSFIHKEAFWRWHVLACICGSRHTSNNRFWQSLAGAGEKEKDWDFILQREIPGVIFCNLNNRERWKKNLSFIFFFLFFPLSGIPFPIIVAWAIGKLYYDNEK